MNLLARLIHAARTLFQRRQVDAEMAEEMRYHREAQIEANLAAGMSRRDATRAANLQFGPADAIAEAGRDARGFSWLAHLRQDLRYGSKMLFKHKGFTFVAVMTLGLGLSANITIFSMVDIFFFQPLEGVKAPSELVVLTRDDPRNEFASSVSWADYEDYRDEVPGVADAVAILMRPVHLGWAGKVPHRTWVELVSPNYFSMLGTQPHLGRLFLPGEGEAIGADPIVVVSHRYWQDRLGGDPGVVGRAVQINGQACEVVGVAAAKFDGAQWGIAPAAWLPAKMAPALIHWDENMFTDRNWNAWRVVGRRAAGYDVDRIGVELAVVDQRIAPLHASGSMDDVVTRVVPEQRSRPEPSVSGFLPLAAAVFLSLVLMILLIACANVANLLFARAASRQREMGIRAAVGATRGRLTRQLLTESLLLATLAGVVGWGLSYVAGIAMAGLSPSGDMPIATESVQGSYWSIVFAVGVSLLAGLVTGLLPALRATRVDLQQVMKGGGSGGQGRRRHWLRNGLVMSQVAFCAVVLVAGGLFLRSLKQASHLELGFDPHQVALASIDLDLQGYSPVQGKTFLDDLTRGVGALPGVDSVALGNVLPMSNNPGLRDVADAAAPKLDETGRREGELQAASNLVDEHFMSTMRVSLLRGRGIERQDTAESPPVVVVNEALAAKLWPGQDAIGQRLTQRWGEPMEVVGVMATGKYVMISEDPRPAYLQPLAQAYNAPVTLFIRTKGEPAAVIPGVQRVLQQLDPSLPVYNVQTMDEHLRTTAFGYMPMRMAAFMAGAQGLVGLLLAVMGVYGVVAFSVSQRTREIGIRLALGAERGDVFRLVIRGGLRLILIGLVVGLLGAVGLSHVLAGLLVGLDPLDIPVFGGVTVVLTGVSLLACYLPARRAMAIDPAVTLKCE
ncbi:ABC transporter permease [Synoicihabitans lomoniglobus]|uniref:ABC transporter permease n=1 Tax=Synoicihabitans lomoniglobus TaxID=2909285 RepID=A0AAE9ZYJ6_9BACT|nr:ABC transporter permease [Opitutaceae bacterium LMO-M01]WED64958.1 ABC transporter permease [Opitutaceae bacterium LMO-M01]